MKKKSLKKLQLSLETLRVEEMAEARIEGGCTCSCTCATCYSPGTCNGGPC